MHTALAPARWPDIDDQDLLPADSPARRVLVRSVVVVAVLVASGYLVWRTLFTVADASWWLAWPLLALEIHSVLTFLLYAHVLWEPASLAPPEPSRAPRHSVTVLIPTYNEPAEVLLPTVAAAVALEQAQEVWLLDDGRRDWVRALAGSLGVRYRTRPDNSFAKAGNINAALPHVQTDLVAVLDADHVVRADFLRNVLGYFDDPAVALVQTPQSFYNTDSFEHEYRGRLRYCEQDLFYRLLAEARNRWGAAFWCGTNSVVRVRALREVGGVATETVTEDIHTSVRLHRAGWRTAYHNEVLARGLAAANSGQYLSQRLRWGTGAMQLLRTENPLSVSGLTWHQRLSYASTVLGWFDSWRTLGFIVVPMLAVLTGGVPAMAPVLPFVTAFFVTWGAQRLAMQMLARGRAPLWPSTVFEFVRMPAAIRATFALMSGQHQPFTVTDKGRTGDARRAMRLPFLLLALLAGIAISGAWYVGTLLHLTPVTYEVPWVAHASALWTLVNAAFLLGAVRRIRAARFGSERRAAVRFPVSGSALVNGATATVDDLSITGARVVTDSGLQSGERVTLDLAPLLHHTVRARVCSSRLGPQGHLVGLEFDDLSPDARGQLVLELFQTGSTPALAQRHEDRQRPLSAAAGGNTDRYHDSTHDAASIPEDEPFGPRWGGPPMTAAALS
jgi:cellulose synthase (UDP-forming)